MARLLPANVHGVLVASTVLRSGLLETINDRVRHQAVFRVDPHEFIDDCGLLRVIYAHVDNQPAAQRLQAQATGKAQASL